jgi:ankyrin repeat protein
MANIKLESRGFLSLLLGAGLFCVEAGRAAEIHHAAQRDDGARIRELLATNSTLVNLPGKDEMTPLHTAARNGSFAAVAALLEHGAEVNAKDTHGCTPLHSAIYGHHTAVARFLLDRGADANAARSEGATPLYYAAKAGDTNLVSLLLARGAKPHVPTGVGYIPLHAAVQGEHTAVAEMLVAAGASVEAGDRDGYTPLHLAAKAGNRTMAEWLLNHGASADAKDRLSFKPLDYVTGPTNDALVSLLEQHMKPRLAPSPSLKVGEAGDPDRIVFEGLQTFTPAQIRRALAIKPGYLLAAHPQANMAAFLSELKTLIESGYQAAGFPDACAEVRYDEPAFTVRVKVVEGPRFRAGKVRVAGPKIIEVEGLVNWFTTPVATPKAFGTLMSAATGKEKKDASPDQEWSTSVNLEMNPRPGAQDMPGKAVRPDDPLWVPGDPANFSVAWATQAVAQADACLAGQGFFFPRVRVELPRTAAGMADLLITVDDEGPPGVIGEFNVTGMKRHTAAEILRFLDLREGMKITAGRLAAARQRLRSCGRFRDFEITPQSMGLRAVSSHRVKLLIAVKELEAVPRLNEPLSPVQEALLKLCAWAEQFPERDEDIQFAITNHSGVPFAVELVLSPKRGVLLNSADLDGGSPVAAGLLLQPETVQFCAWSSGNKLAAPRGNVGSYFFLHLLPDKNEDGNTNRFHLNVGAGFSATASCPLKFDVQLTPAAFLDFPMRTDCSCLIEGDLLVVTGGGFTLRAEARTGRLLRVDGGIDQPPYSLRFGGHVWDRAAGDFERRAAALTNRYTPGRGPSSFLTFAAIEAARCWLAVERAASVSAKQRARALAAVNRLVNPEILHPLDRFLGRETNAFNIPLDDVDQAIGQNSMLAFLSGFAFDYSGELFPKYSWPWTVARETAFITLNQGRYTDVELDRLHQSAETGPIGCLMIARLLEAAGVRAAKDFALQGSQRLGADDFLRDCNLFLRGESGLARSFARTAEVLRKLPEEEFVALAAVLSDPEAMLLRESRAALRARPEAAPATVLAPALENYWEKSLRAQVSESLRQIAWPATEAGQRATGM